ncbi:hypothetical protein, partial [Sulfuricurvum sp.]|uniref:hypothetical protein n=1 Tax=Sulfuricurvum sp. TaxID=2025608 RepID=UPI003BB631E1
IIITENDDVRQYSIDQEDSHYEICLQDGSEWYGGKSPVFESAEDAFLFVLKIMSWVNSSIKEIKIDYTFLDESKIRELCNIADMTVLVTRY